MPSKRITAKLGIVISISLVSHLVLGKLNATINSGDVLDTLFQRISYRRSIPPSQNGPTIVQVGIYIRMFHEIDEKSRDFTLTLYLRQRWKDPRLQFEDLTLGVDEIRLEDQAWNKLWVPDLYFTNAKKADFTDVTVSNRLLTLNATGHIWYSSEIRGTFTCPMIYVTYPFDNQTCSITIESFGYTEDTLKLAWQPSNVGFDRHAKVSQYSITGVNLQEFTADYVLKGYPCLTLDVLLRRKAAYFINQVYLPSALMVTLSWIPFWFEAGVDVLLAILIVLTILMQTYAAEIPKTSSTTSLDVWFIACITHVYAVLVFVGIDKVLVQRAESGHAGRLKMRCRVGFPVSYFMFMSVYFILYRFYIINNE